MSLARSSRIFATSVFLLAAPTGLQADGLLYTLVGDTPGDRFGAAVSGIGDVDGDGCADLVIGAPRAAPGGPLSGSARVVSGSDGSLLFSIPGDSPGDWLGTSVASAGDVDGDGVGDVLLGAPRGTPAAGSVQLHSGASGALIRTWVGATAGDCFGDALAGLGDVDGDGVPDVAVGAPLHDGAGLNAGRVEVYSGATGGLLHAFDGGGFDLFGTAVAGPGDYDGDGFADVLIGAPLADGGAFNAGSAQLRSGRDGALLAAFHGAVVGDQLGHAVAGAGDLDGDGRPDLILGAPGADANGIDSGAAEVISSASGARSFRVAGTESGAYLHAVAGLGDLDGDGRPEIVVGAASTSASAVQAGRALVVRGALGGPALVLDGRSAYDWFGASVAGVGGVDGDGWPDVAIGAPVSDDVLSVKGYVRVYSGRLLMVGG